MPITITHEGQEIVVYTQSEVDAEVQGLKVTNQNLKDEKKGLADKLAEQKEAVRAAEEAKAKAEGDSETLRRLAEERDAEKRAAIEEERAKFAKLVEASKRDKVSAKLGELVAELKPADAARAKQLAKLIRSDYTFDVDMDTGDVSVTGEGVANLADLKGRIENNPDYSHFLAGSGATGGGSTGGTTSGAGKPFHEMNDAERIALKKSSPAEFYKLSQVR